MMLYKGKHHLLEIHSKIKTYLEKNLDLTVKENHQIFPTRTRGIDFVGYRHYGDYILLRKSTVKTLKRKLRRILAKCKNGHQLTYSEWCSINSYEGWVIHCNGYNLTNKYIKPLQKYADKYYKEVIKKNETVFSSKRNTGKYSKC